MLIRRRYALAVLGACALAMSGPAAASQIEALYVVRQAGFRVMEARVVMELGPRGYRISADTRTTGLAILFANSATRVEVEGRWLGHGVVPDRYSSVGTWNGQARQVEMRYRDAAPELLALVPPDSGERMAVTEEQRRGTVDVLSALIRLAREAGATGRCDGVQSVFDGRRRLEWAVRTELVPADIQPAAGWTGPVLRCAFTSRMVAGFRLVDDSASAGRERQGTAWLATIRPDLPPIPVRVEFRSGMLGVLRAELVRLDRPAEAVRDGSGHQPVQ